MANTFIFFPDKSLGTQQVVSFRTAVDNITNAARKAAIKSTLPLFQLTDNLIETSERTSYLNTPVFSFLEIGDPASSTANKYINLLGETVSYDPIVLFDMIIF